MKNLYDPKFIKKIANNLFKKLSYRCNMQLPVTNYCFLRCSVVIKAIVNTCFSSIICYIGKFYFEDFLYSYFKLFKENYMKIIITGQIPLLKYNSSRFSKQSGKFVQILLSSN
jgi:hypothetical protein